MPVGTQSSVCLEIAVGDSAAPVRQEIRERALIGRSAGSDVVIDHPSVSRKHAELSSDDQGRWFVRDLDSRNGTMVNGAPAKQRMIQHGDQISIGEVVVRFLMPGSQSGEAHDSEDAPGFTISSLHQMPRPRLASEQVAAILSFGRSLESATDAQDRLHRLLELMIRPEIGGWWAYALDVRSQQDQIQMRNLHAPLSSAMGSSREPYVSKSVLRAVIEQGEPLVANRLARMQHFQAEMTVSPEANKFSAVACPLTHEPGRAEVLYVVLPPDLAGVEWLMLISLAVEQYRHAAAAAEARAAGELQAAHERENALARRVQARTLPRRMAPLGLDWSVCYEPCLAVAGDYVDVIARDDGSVILLVADAAGKGMQAALITAGLHAIFHTQGRSDVPLAQVVLAADRYLKKFLSAESFVTFCGLLLNPTTGAGTSVNCGHPPLLAINASGQLRELEGGDNLPLGLCEINVVESTIQLAEDEWLIGYTDGLTEMRNVEGEMLGPNRLYQHLQEACSSSQPQVAAQLCGCITQFLESFRGEATPGDDRTLLLVRRTPAIDQAGS